MTYYKQIERRGTYCAFGDADNHLSYVRIKEIYRGNDNVLFVAERDLPNSSAKELCIVKETGYFRKEGFTRCPPHEFTKDSVVVELGSYLRQLSIVDHANVIKFHGHGKSNHGIGTFKLVLICGYCPGGDLEQYLEMQAVPLPPTQTVAYAKQILDGLCYLHMLKAVTADAKNVIHCDIKPSNLFLCDYRQGVGYMTIKIGDHDDPVYMIRSKTHQDDVKAVRGTMLYVSPEMCLLQENGKVGRKTDTWSVGCVILKMGLGSKELEFSTEHGPVIRTGSSFKTFEEYRAFVALGGGPISPTDLHDVLAVIITACLVRDPNDRPSAHQLADTFKDKLQLASDVFLQCPASCVEIGRKWKAEFKPNTDYLQISEHYWVHDHLYLLSERMAFDLEWLYILHKLQKSSFDGPITIQCNIKSFTAMAVLKDYITDLTIENSAYILNEQSPFADTIFPNLASFAVDHNSMVEKLDAVFTCAPNLVEVLLHGAKFAGWDEITARKVPTSLRYMEWRLHRDSTSEVLDNLLEMDQHEDFALFRSYLQENPSLATAKQEAELFVIGGTPSRAHPLHRPWLFDTNFLCFLGKDMIFERGRRLQAWVTKAYLESCTCPIKREFCVFTCMNDSSHYSITITGDVEMNEWAKFWENVWQTHSTHKIGYTRLFTAVTLRGISLDTPVEFTDLYAGLLVIQGYSSVSSKQLSKWGFDDVLQVTFRDCRQVSLYTGDLSRTFPLLESIAMDNSTFKIIEENVFDEFKGLKHLCLDGERLHEIIQRSETNDTAIDPDIYNHLKKLHFEVQYEWLRIFLDRNPDLTGSKERTDLLDMEEDSYQRSRNYLQLVEVELEGTKLLRLKPPSHDYTAEYTSSPKRFRRLAPVPCEPN